MNQHKIVNTALAVIEFPKLTLEYIHLMTNYRGLEERMEMVNWYLFFLTSYYSINSHNFRHQLWQHGLYKFDIKERGLLIIGEKACRS